MIMKKIFIENIALENVDSDIYILSETRITIRGYKIIRKLSKIFLKSLTRLSDYSSKLKLLALIKKLNIQL